MSKLLLVFTLLLGLNIFAYASADNRAHIKPISEAKLKKMDHKFTKHKAVKRNFKTHKEFLKRQRRISKRHVRRVSSKHMHRYSRHYDNGYNYNWSGYREAYRPVRQRGYSHSNRGWYLAYKYDRAPFYDDQGYFYGYFNRYGYYFEDVFYRYDRYYTYRDRVKGRGLFDHRYYMPANANYYGFCETRHYDYNYERDYSRY